MEIFELPSTAESDLGCRWTPDGQALTYVDTPKGVTNVWSQPLEGGAPRRITGFTSDQIFTFDWSRDGKQLALFRGTPTRNGIFSRRIKSANSTMLPVITAIIVSGRCKYSALIFSASLSTPARTWDSVSSVFTVGSLFA